jgi:signal transduction histidine kinase
MTENSQHTVLSVDDNDALRYSLARCLREGGYNVIEARTGAEAMRLARQDPSLITLDVNLPDIDGFEVCRRLKANPQTSQIPVLHVSASFVGTEHRIRGLEGGADGYLTQPINPEELLATVGTLLRIRRAEREARLQAEEANKVREQLRSINQELERRVRERTSELENRNSEIQELSRRLLRAQDDERRRVSRELHDSTGQSLVMLKMNLSALKSESTQANPKAVGLIAEMDSIVEDITRQLRTMSYLLHPPLLDEAGLASALTWYVEGFSHRSGIQVSLDLPGDMGRLSQDLEITIFRIVQESLTNIHRHSGSKLARVRLTREPQEVRLEITDAGRGLPTSDDCGDYTSFRSGVGILGMKERVRQFGGRFEIASRFPGVSTFVALPLRQPSAA